MWKVISVGILITLIVFLVANNVSITPERENISLISVNEELFTVKIPSQWKSFRGKSPEHLVTYSDLGDTNFKSGAISIYKMAGVATNVTDFSEKTCRDHLMQSIEILFAQQYPGIAQNTTSFDKERMTCSIEFITTNKQSDGTIGNQIHKQRLIIKDKDEYIVEVITAEKEFPPYLNEMLDSVKIK